MKKNIVLACWILCVLGIEIPSWAGNYFLQNSFSLPSFTVGGMDSDSVGNLYVLAFPAGSGSPSVYGYSTPQIQPIFSFGAGIASTGAFAVEASGVVDVLDMNSLTLKRFQNNGTFIGQTAYSLPYIQVLAAAIDKVNQRVYLSYTFNVYCVMSIGSTCTGGVHGVVNQYDFQGNYLKGIAMPGSSAAGSCYTPSVLAVDPQGNVAVADAQCGHVLKFSSAGNLMANVASTNWSYGFSPRSMWTDSASNLYISQTICTNYSNCQAGIAKLDGGLNFLTSFYADSVTGGAWDSRILYLGTSNSTPLRRFIYDNPPSVAVETSPLGSVGQHSSSAQLSWQPSSDPDGDPVTYSVYLGNASNQLVFIGSTTGTSSATPALSFGTGYYWQVAAQGYYLGLPLQTQASPVVSFTPSFVNNPPGAFAAARGMGTAVTRNTSVTLSWQASADPDGDPVTYDVFWRASGQTASQTGSTSGTSWTMSGLSFGTTYFWSVIARDPYWATTPMSGGEQSYSLIFKNSPPPSPTIIGGNGVSAQHTLTPQATLSWSSVIDPDGDPVSYRIAVGTSVSNLAAAQDSAQTSYALPSPQLGTTYYWQVTAYDPYGASSATAVQSLLILLQNNPPYPIVYTSTSVFISRATNYALSWQDTGDPDGDPTTYSLYLGTNPATLPQVQQGAQTSFTLNFQFGTTYYWSVSATDNFGAQTNGSVQTFLPVFKNSPPTVPVNQSQVGTVPYHGLTVSQSFFWQNSTDPDGDPFTYSLYFGTSSSNLAVTTSAPLGFTVSNLGINTAYYYKITATDVYGASQDAPLNWVYFQFYNNPPKNFDVIGGTGTVNTRNMSATLSWTPAVDPDGDFVMYRVYVGTSPAALAPMADTSVTSLKVGLSFGTTLNWKVDAYDPFGGTTTINGGVQSLFAVFSEGAISPVVYVSSAASYGIHSTSPTITLSWLPSFDSDGDTLSYHVDVQANGNTTDYDVGLSTSLTIGVQFETTYYWRVAASDPYGNVSTGSWASAIAHFVNHPPNPFGPLSGFGLAATRSSSATISWQNMGDPDGDPLIYQFSLGTDSSAVSLGANSILLTTSSYALSSLTYGVTYYWNVTAVDPFGARTPMSGGVQSYLAAFKNDPPVAVPNSLTDLPSGQIKTSSPSVHFLWPAYTSPDGDKVSYSLYAGNAGSALTSLATGSGAVYQGSGNSFTMNSLQYGVVYSYRIQVQTDQGAVAQGPSGTFTLVPNSAQTDPYNYPSPFRVGQGTNFVFTALSPVDWLRVSVYSVYQQLVWWQELGAQATGVHQIHWDGRDSSGRAVFSGLYLAVFESNAGRQMVRTVAVR